MKKEFKVILEVNSKDNHIEDLKNYLENIIENQLETDESADLIEDDWNFEVTGD